MLLVVSLCVEAKESCDLKSLHLNESSSLAQKLFYTGTCHYRNGDYGKCATLWRQLSELDEVPSEDADLQIDSLNNLGYLLFFGYGVEIDQKAALGYWQKAISLGHYESEYHLCHAYADRSESTYEPVKAKRHCEKAQLIYQGLDKTEKDNETILNQINNYLMQLES